MSKVISIVNIKGGVGKTTISINLSAGISDTGRKILLIDTDPQESATDWVRKRNELNESEITHKNFHFYNNEFKPLKAKETIAALKKDYDLIIFDNPPKDYQTVIRIIANSDFCIIPISTSASDIKSTKQMVDIIQEGKRKKLFNVSPFLLISNKFIGTTVGNQFRQTINIMDIPIMKTEINHRISLLELSYLGKTIFEYEGNSFAADEFRSLAKEVTKWL
ncbi:MAG: ParA family protein [Proteobacteria bacterium]|nr:ParA family protein [bacterium]MBU4003021.1 ParA family protein [Pseudomonadota bacterium]MBU4056270.1 ParA family protein [Pseudomonadota bacterium]